MNDPDLIKHFGGPARLAALLGYPAHGGVQRIQNWMTRGIPSSVKVDRPDLFLANPPPDPAKLVVAPAREAKAA